MTCWDHSGWVQQKGTKPFCLLNFRKQSLIHFMLKYFLFMKHYADCCYSCRLLIAATQLNNVQLTTHVLCIYYHALVLLCCVYTLFLHAVICCTMVLERQQFKYTVYKRNDNINPLDLIQLLLINSLLWRVHLSSLIFTKCSWEAAIVGISIEYK